VQTVINVSCCLINCEPNNSVSDCDVFADVILYRKPQRQTNEEVMDMNVFANDAALNNATSQYETLTDKEPVYDVPIEDVAAFDNPIMDDDVRYVKEPSAAADDRNAYESIHDDQPYYTPLTPPSSDNIGSNDTEEPLADDKYLVLLDDEGKLGNAPEVPPPREDNNTQETPGDNTYLVLLDDEENTPDVPTPRDDIDEHHASCV